MLLWLSLDFLVELLILLTHTIDLTCHLAESLLISLALGSLLLNAVSHVAQSVFGIRSQVSQLTLVGVLLL